MEAETSFINSSGEQNMSTASPNNENKLTKLLNVYKAKYGQLKNAYDEVEAEKEKVKVGF